MGLVGVFCQYTWPRVPIPHEPHWVLHIWCARSNRGRTDDVGFPTWAPRCYLLTRHGFRRHQSVRADASRLPPASKHTQLHLLVVCTAATADGGRRLAPCGCARFFPGLRRTPARCGCQPPYAMVTCQRSSAVREAASRWRLWAKRPASRCRELSVASRQVTTTQVKSHLVIHRVHLVIHRVALSCKSPKTVGPVSVPGTARPYFVVASVSRALLKRFA